MKINFNIPLTILSVVLFAACAIAGVPLKWDVDTSKTTVKQFDAWNGETLDLEATLCAYRSAIDLTGKDARIYWQTNGMGSVYWQTNATVVASNVLVATFTPDMNPGARAIMGFIGVAGEIYRAAFSIRFSGSPGATPHTIELPVKVIDFAKVTVLNPPWSGGGGGGVDTNAVRDIAREEIVPATNAVNVAMTNRYTKAETDAKLSPIEAQIAALQDGKQDTLSEQQLANIDDVPKKADEFTEWVCTPSIAPYYMEWFGEETGSAGWAPSDSSGWVGVKKGGLEDTSITWSADEWSGGFAFTAARKRVLRTGDAATPQELTTKQNKITVSGVLKGDGSGGVTQAEKSSTSDDPANADYRDPTDNTCRKTEFGEWVFDCPPNVRNPHAVVRGEFEWFASADYYSELDDKWFSDVGFSASGNEDADALEFNFEFYSFTATRSAVCTDGKKFVTEDIVDGKVSAAVSTNNPEFVSAVRAIAPTTIRIYDNIRQCWWVLEMVNGVPTWTVED